MQEVKRAAFHIRASSGGPRAAGAILKFLTKSLRENNDKSFPAWYNNSARGEMWP